MPERDALADARAGEDAHPLPSPARQQPVDRPDARAQRRVDRRAAAGVRRRAVESRSVLQGRLGLLVHGVALGVDHAAEQGVAHAQPPRRPRQPHAVAAPHAVEAAEGVEQRQVVAESDHLRPQRRPVLPLDVDQRPDRRGKPGHRGRHPDRPRHAARQRRRHDGIELFNDVEHGGWGLGIGVGD